MTSPEEKRAAEQERLAFVASLEEATNDLDRNGPVPGAELRLTLQQLFAELSKEPAAE